MAQLLHELRQQQAKNDLDQHKATLAVAERGRIAGALNDYLTKFFSRETMECLAEVDEHVKKGTMTQVLALEYVMRLHAMSMLEKKISRDMRAGAAASLGEKHELS